MVNRTVRDGSADDARELVHRPALLAGLSIPGRSGWDPHGGVRYAVKGARWSLRSRAMSLGFGDPSKPIRFDFKWADNIQNLDPIEFTVNGDTAPNGRFAYRYRGVTGGSEKKRAEAS